MILPGLGVGTAPPNSLTRIFGQGATYHAGDDYWVLLPPGWQGDGTRRPLMLTHSGSGQAESMTYQEYDMVMAGFPIMSCDYGGPALFGNDTQMARTTEALDWAGTEWGCLTDQCVMYGLSQGGCHALVYAAENPDRVAAMAIFDPVVNTDDIHDNNRVGLATYIEAAYGGLAGWNAAEPTKNPYNLFDELEAWGGPILCMPALNDSVCLYTFAQQLDAAVSNCTLNVWSTGDHASTNPPRNMIAAFLQPYVYSG